MTDAGDGTLRCAEGSATPTVARVAAIAIDRHERCMNIPPGCDERKPRSIRRVVTPKSARMIAPRDGTSVAISERVRPFFLAWLTVALLLLALGRLSHAGDELSVAGFV